MTVSYTHLDVYKRQVRGIVFEKRQFFARFDLLTQNDNNLSIKLRKNRE